MIGFDPNVLLGLYQSQVTATGGSALSKKQLPTPPWQSRLAAPPANELTRKALAGSKFINLSAAQLDVRGASEDYRKLFGLYQGLTMLSALASRADAKGVTAGELSRVQGAFSRGLGEIAAFTEALKLDQVRLVSGAVAGRFRSEAGVRRDTDQYITCAVHSGSATEEVTAFQGDVQFNVSVKRLNSTFNVAIDLSEMGTTPRTMGAVVNFINGKLSDAGVSTRFASHRMPNEPRTVQVGGKAVTLPAVTDSWAFKIEGGAAETVTFSAAATAGAVYVAQQAGKVPTAAEIKDGTVDATERQLLKFQTDTTSVPSTGLPGDRVFQTAMGKEVAAVRATAMGADGALYVLAEVDGESSEQLIQGAQDVALMKYDSTGKLLYTRTLGAADEASGLALSVSAEGKVAIAGSVTGALNGAAEGALNSGAESEKSDSFVTLFNADGEELWTVRRGAREDDVAQAVAFGDDGTVYVAGRTQSAMMGATTVGGFDNYLTAIATQAAGQPKTLFTQQFGSVGDDRVGGIAVKGDQIVVAGVESGSAVLRSFSVTPTTVTTDKVTSGGVLTTTITTRTGGVVTDTQSTNFTTGAADSSSSTVFTTSAALTAGAVRSLGTLAGGEISGVAFNGTDVIVAGTTGSGALVGGTVTSAYTSGKDAFVAKMTSALTADAADRITYFGGDGDDSATAVTVAGGKVWIAGDSASTTLDGAAKLGVRDGYVASLDADTGAVGWFNRYTAKEGVAAPTSIAVDVAGASVLDRLGLPKNELTFKESELVTAGTSLRAGDQFFIRAKEGARPVAITIEAKDTLQSLAAKVRRAAGFSAKVEVVREGDYSKLQIRPLNDRSTVEVIAGKGGRDALDSLGLQEGAARISGGAADEDKKIYGLRLSKDLNLNDKEAIKAAMQQVDEAMSRIRLIYRDLQKALEPQSTSRSATGPVPAYLQNQLSNYQAGLNRLLGTG